MACKRCTALHPAMAFKQQQQRIIPTQLPTIPTQFSDPPACLPACLPMPHLQHDAATMENEQLWNALLHIHASLRAAHAAHLRQQVAMHAAAVAAAVLPPASVQAPSPNLLFGGLFSPGG